MAPKLLGRGTEDAPRESRERNLLPQCRAVVQRSAKREAGSWSIHMFQELSLQEYFGCSSTEHRSRHEKLPWRLFRINSQSGELLFSGQHGSWPSCTGFGCGKWWRGSLQQMPSSLAVFDVWLFRNPKERFAPLLFPAAPLLPADKYIIRSLPHII